MNLMESPGRKNDPGGMPRRTISQTIAQYWIHYLIIVPVILYLLLFKGMPVIYGLLVAFKDFEFYTGVLDSDWIGFSNFAELFQHTDFAEAIANTVQLKLSFLVFSGAAAFLAALAVSGIASARTRHWISAIMVFPYFIPSTILAYLGLHYLQLFLGHPLGAEGDGDLLYPSYLWLVPILLYTIKYGGITLIVALGAITAKRNSLDNNKQLHASAGGYWKSTAEPAARAVAAAILVQAAFMLTTDRELLDSFLDPIVFGGKETVDYFIFRQGFMMVNFSLASAAWLIQLSVNALFMALAFFLIRNLFKGDLFPQEEPSSSVSHAYRGKKGVAGYAIGLIAAVLALFLLYQLYVYPHLGAAPYPVRVLDALSLFGMLQYGVGYLIVTLFSVVAIALMAYPLTVRKLPGGMVYRICLLLAACVTTTISIHDYLMYQRLGMVNTIFPVLLAGFQPFISVFVLKAIFNSRYGHLKTQAEREGRGELSTFVSLFIPKMWKVILALGVLQFVAMWEASMPSRVYISDPSMQSPLMMIWNMGQQSSLFADGYYHFVLLLAGIVALPPILLFIIFRKWLVSEVLVGSLLKR